MNCFFSKGRINSDFARDAAVFVNNCGYYKDMDTPQRINRPNGRGDYHLLLCVRGGIEVNGTTLANGEAFLFFPRQKQSYTYLPAEESLYYWVHFTGVEIERLLQKASLDAGKINCRARISELESLFRMLVAMRAETLSTVEELTAGLLCSVLMLLPNAQTPASPFPTAIRRLEDLETPVTVAELAAHYRMSRAHFIRSFRAYFGTTPLQYRKTKQIELAQMLLADSPLLVAEISARVGIDDPLYFSRIFKAHTGRTPLAYRKERNCL